MKRNATRAPHGQSNSAFVQTNSSGAIDSTRQLATSRWSISNEHRRMSRIMSIHTRPDTESVVNHNRHSM